MSRQLLILRHAKSDWTTAVAADFDRPLAKRGRKAAKVMGRWLGQQGLLPDAILSSPALRARQTVLRLCEAAGVSEKLIRWKPSLYGAEVDNVLQLLAACEADLRRVMVVGHNPELEQLLRHLAGAALEVPAEGKLLPTGALAVLEVQGPWEALRSGTVRLQSLTRPRDLEG
jgi:phosphohistidine phosphatase